MLSGFLGYVYMYMDEQSWTVLSSEENFPEMGAVFLFCLTAFLALVVFFAERMKSWLYFSILMVLAAMRELDLHKEWTTDSILKSNFYKSMDTPVIEKIIGGAVILLLLYMAFYFAKRLPKWIGDLWHLREQAWAIGLALGCLTVAKLMDSMSRWLPFLADFHAENRAFLGVMEESLEMTGSLFFVLVCLCGLSPLMRKRH